MLLYISTAKTATTLTLNRCMNVTESLGEWAGPLVCLNLPSVPVDKGLDSDHHFSFYILSCSQIKDTVGAA